MFDKTFFCNMVRNKLKEEYRTCALWIIDQVELEGGSAISLERLLGSSAFSEQQVLSALRAMACTEPVPLVRREYGILVFDYPEREVDPVNPPFRS